MGNNSLDRRRRPLCTEAVIEPEGVETLRDIARRGKCYAFSGMPRTTFFKPVNLAAKAGAFEQREIGFAGTVWAARSARTTPSSHSNFS
jgi:hypothetical protein